jgi:hypothetical protein
MATLVIGGAIPGALLLSNELLVDGTDTWTPGVDSLVIWQLASLAVAWQLGSLAAWQLGSLAAWQLGSLPARQLAS